jgi:hypothetical protein
MSTLTYSSGTYVRYDYKYFSQCFGKKCVFCLNYLQKKLIITLVFEKNAYLAEMGKIS